MIVLYFICMNMYMFYKLGWLLSMSFNVRKMSSSKLDKNLI